MKILTTPLTCLMGVALASSIAAADNAALPKPPKAIVLIYADDLGYGDIGCNGATTIPTPAIDTLAKHGIRFTDAYSTSAVCTPSRYALLTGEYPWRRNDTNILQGDAKLLIDTNAMTLPKMLQKYGYKTAAFGKWHLGLGKGPQKTDWNKHISPSPNEVGFDESFIFAATGDRVPCVIINNGNVVNLDPSDPIEVSYQKNFPGLPDGKSARSTLKMDWSHGHNQAVINGIGRIGFMKGGASAIWNDEENANLITQKAIEFINKNAKSDQPFFIYFATHDIHVPRCPSKKFQGASKCGVRGDVAVELDDCVKRIMQALNANGLGKDSLVIFSSDNGPVLDDGYKDRANEDRNGHNPAGPFTAGKYSILEGGSRIPFIVYWPAAIKGGQTSKAIINQMDIAGSLQFLLDPNSKPLFKDAENRLAALLGKDDVGRKYHIVNSSGKMLAIRSGKWKYLPPGTPMRIGLNGGGAKMEKAPEEGALFNLEEDPAEKNNVAASNPDICKTLKAKLEEIKQSPINEDNLVERFATDD